MQQANPQHPQEHAPPSPREFLTLADVARLAGVQRPVVTVWRSRNRGGRHPFPAPARTHGQQELFDAGQVVDWLGRTGLGNNVHAAQDVAAHVVDARDRFTAVSALLALRAALDEPLAGLDAADLLDAADEQDPEDAFLYAELEALGADLPALAAYTDRLVDAAYGAAPAFERLLAESLRTALPGHASTSLSAQAHDVVAAAALEIGAGARLFAETTPGGTDLLLAVADLLGEDTDGTFQLPRPSAGTGGRPERRPSDRATHQAAHRLALRRLRIHARTRDNVNLRHPAEPAPGTVNLAQFPGPALADQAPAAMLEAIDELVLALGPTERAVVIAPAALLVDRLADPNLDNVRAATLRSGRVRAAVRLPRGLRPSAPRQALALWVLGPEPAGVPLGERWVMVADLLDAVLDWAAVQDLATDLAASLGGREAIRRHAFRFARLVRTPVLLARRSLVEAPRGPATGVAVPGESLLRAEAALDAVNATGARRGELGFGVVPGAPRVPATGTTPARRTLGALSDAGQVRCLPGARMDEDDVVPDAARGASPGVRVWRAEDLGRAAPGASIPALVLAARYPRAKMTEPGDIVFSAGPHPAAAIDAGGAAVVRYPARILRINAADAGGLVAAVVAADINAGAAGSWRRWVVRTVPPDGAAALAAALARLEDERAAAAERVARIAALADRLVAGVAAHELEIIDTDTPMEGRP